MNIGVIVCIHICMHTIKLGFYGFHQRLVCRRSNIALANNEERIENQNEQVHVNGAVIHELLLYPMHADFINAVVVGYLVERQQQQCQTDHEQNSGLIVVSVIAFSA